MARQSQGLHDLPDNAYLVDVNAWSKADSRNPCFYCGWHSWDAGEAATAYCCARGSHFQALHYLSGIKVVDPSVSLRLIAALSERSRGLAALCAATQSEKRKRCLLTLTHAVRHTFQILGQLQCYSITPLALLAREHIDQS